MSRQEVSIPVPDGNARAFAFTPATGSGPWPAAIIYMDAPAIRPAMFEMGQRLADAGYFVLLPDMFWRLGPYEMKDAKDRFAEREKMMEMMKSTDAEKAMRDTGGFLAWLSAQPQVKGEKVGTTGYCMGGGLSLRAAATFPDRVVAAAAFHGGGMATDAPNSPHLGAGAIRAKVLVAGADKDAGFDEAQKDRLAKALSDAKVDAQVSIWPGALHGWVPTDTPVHNPEAAERHWRELIALFDSKLK